MKLLSVNIALLFLSSSIAFAQGYFCGSDRVNKRLMEQDPEFKSRIDDFEKVWQAYNNSMNKKNISGGDTTYEIPIVIHVINTGGAIGSNYNPADTQLINW